MLTFLRVITRFFEPTMQPFISRKSFFTRP